MSRQPKARQVGRFLCIVTRLFTLGSVRVADVILQRLSWAAQSAQLQCGMDAAGKVQVAAGQLLSAAGQGPIWALQGCVSGLWQQHSAHGPPGDHLSKFENFDKGQFAS